MSSKLELVIQKYVAVMITALNFNITRLLNLTRKRNITVPFSMDLGHKKQEKESDKPACDKQ